MRGAMQLLFSLLDFKMTNIVKIFSQDVENKTEYGDNYDSKVGH